MVRRFLLFALALVACGAPAPARVRVVASPPAPAPVVAPPPPPRVFHGIEHPVFVASDSGPRWIFGPAFSRVATPAVLPLGATVRVRYAVCDFDETGPTPRASCRSLARKTFEALPFGDIAAPLGWRFWNWAKDHFTFVDAPVDPSIARRYGAAHVAHATPQLGDDLLVTFETTWTLVDEAVQRGGGGRAMPVVQRTGRKIRRAEHNAAIVFEGVWMPSTLLDDYLPLGASLTGSGAEAVHARWVTVWSATPPKSTPLTKLLTDAYTGAARPAAALEQLESNEQDDPDVRIAVLVDRALLAWQLRDKAAIARATAGLDAELAKRDAGALDPAVKSAVDVLLPWLHRLRDEASVDVVPAVSLDAWR